MTEIKSCSKCGEDKPLREFYVKTRSSGKTDLYAHCKRCHNGLTRSGYHGRHKALHASDQWHSEVREKRCFSCGEVKDASNFHKHRSSKDGLLHRCRQCDALRRRARRESGEDAAERERASVRKRLRRAQHGDVVRERERRADKIRRDKVREMRDALERKTCSVCGTNRERFFFACNVKAKDGLQSFCRLCQFNGRKSGLSKSNLFNSGYVYCIRLNNGETKSYYKIGVSDDVNERLIALQGSLPFLMETTFSRYVPCARLYEAAMHYYMRDKRLSGEWFELDEEDIALLRDLSLDLELGVDT